VCYFAFERERKRERERETSASWKRMGLMALMQYMRAEGRPFWHRTLSRIQDARHRRGESIYRNSRHCQREEMAIMVPTIFAAFFVPQVIKPSSHFCDHVHIYFVLCSETNYLLQKFFALYQQLVLCALVSLV
jgi:hypothetical protein